MIKRTISILIADDNHYFVDGFRHLLKAFCHLRGISLHLLDRNAHLKDKIDIIFLSNCFVCPPWLQELYQQGYTPQVFFIQEQGRNKLSPKRPTYNSECGAGVLYRHQTAQSIEALLDKVLYSNNQAGSPYADKCRCLSPLTTRETEVLQCLATGMCIQDTASYLVISNKTVNAHKRSAMHKLHFRRNQELHKWFVQGGLQI